MQLAPALLHNIRTVMPDGHHSCTSRAQHSTAWDGTNRPHLQYEIKGQHLEAGVSLDALWPSHLPVPKVAGNKCLDRRQVGLDGLCTEGGLQQGAQRGVAQRVLHDQQVVLA